MNYSKDVEMFSFIDTFVTEEIKQNGINYLKLNNIPVEIKQFEKFAKKIFDDIRKLKLINKSKYRFNSKQIDDSIHNNIRSWYIEKLTSRDMSDNQIFRLWLDPAGHIKEELSINFKNISK